MNGNKLNDSNCNKCKCNNFDTHTKYMTEPDFHLISTSLFLLLGDSNFRIHYIIKINFLTFKGNWVQSQCTNAPISRNSVSLIISLLSLNTVLTCTAFKWQRFGIFSHFITFTKFRPETHIYGNQN